MKSRLCIKTLPFSFIVYNGATFMDNKMIVVKEKLPSTSPNADQVYDFELVCPEVVQPGNFFRCSGIFFAGSGVRVRLSATDFDPSIAVQISENVHVPGKSASSQFYDADTFF